MTEHTLRKNLGDFNSIICFRAIVVGLEKIMGTEAARGNLIRAGKLRGAEVVQDLNLSKTDKPISEWLPIVAGAIGKEGTCLCELVRVEQKDNKFLVYLSDTICSADEEQGSDRKLSFTQGAILGAVEELTGHRMSSEQVGSILRGDDYDIVELTIR